MDAGAPGLDVTGGALELLRLETKIVFRDEAQGEQGVLVGDQALLEKSMPHVLAALEILHDGLLVDAAPMASSSTRRTAEEAAMAAARPTSANSARPRRPRNTAGILSARLMDIPKGVSPSVRDKCSALASALRLVAVRSYLYAEREKDA
jgi:hypothetical protein